MAELHEQYPHYYKSVRGLDTIDVYRVLELWTVDAPALQHAVKKILAAGRRGGKDIDNDIAEAIVSLQRWQKMREEDAVAYRNALRDKVEAAAIGNPTCAPQFKPMDYPSNSSTRKPL